MHVPDAAAAQATAAELFNENMANIGSCGRWQRSFPYFSSPFQPTPIAGNFSLVLYFEKRVDVLKLKVTVGPPETEVTRVVSHKDFDAVSAWGSDDPRFRGSRVHAASGGTIPHRSQQGVEGGGGGGGGGRPKKKRGANFQILNSQEEAVLYAFRDEVADNERRQDPLDMCKEADAPHEDSAETLVILR